MAKILIVDDEETIRKLLSQSVTKSGHEAVCAEDGYRALDVFSNFKPDVIISDIKMPKMTGFQMWDQLKAKFESLPPIIFITGHGDKTAAIESLRVGAFDYLEKPFEMSDFSHRLTAAVKKCQMERENEHLTTELNKANQKLQEKLEVKSELVHRIQHGDEKTPYSLEMLGKSACMKSVKETVGKLSENPIGAGVGVLITGASGSGKEVVARLIHEMSSRSKGPWVPVNCGALPESLIESELFGHEKGSFTGAAGRKLGYFELADGGTLFLDEIGELPLSMQSRLLRAIQEKTIRRVGGSEEIKVDVRVVAATNKDLRKCIAEKSFREDLFYRLNTVQIQIPSLKERAEDIPYYAQVLLKQVTSGVPKAPREFLSDCFSMLKSGEWEGNLRELKSVVQRAALLTSGPVVTPESIANAMGIRHATPLARPAALTLAAVNPVIGPPVEESATKTPSKPVTDALTAGMPYHTWKKQYMKTMEKEYLQQKLAHFHGNVSAMSRSMKVSRPNLCRLLKKHGIAAGEFRDEMKQAA